MENPIENPIDIGFWPCVTDDVAVLKALAEATESNWKSERPHEYQAVVDYLSKPDSTRQYRGWSNCRVCGCRNGTQDWFRGPFRYPEGYLHYITEHGVKPPEDIIRVAGEVLYDVKNPIRGRWGDSI